MLTVNRCSCCKFRQSAASGLLICTALAALALPTRAHAQFTGRASATGQFESNSNVFDLESGFVQPPGLSEFRRADTYYAYGAQLEGDYLWGRQLFYATGGTTEYDYQHLTELDHNDYRVDAGLKWALGELWDGKVDIARTHNMVPFFDLTGSELVLSLVTEQKETVRVGLRLSSDWKLEGSAFTSVSNQPIVGAPDLQLRQYSGTAAIDYLGIGNLTSGFTAGVLSGDYSGSSGVNGALNPSYVQDTYGIFANYKHYRTIFEGQLGYSRRASDTGTDNTSGFIGIFDLTQQLTPKTSVTVKIDRTINSYLLNASSEIDSEAGMTINWQATYKLTGSLGYTFSYRDFPRQGNNPVGSDRIDIQEHWTMALIYRPERWLLIRPYADLQARRTTFVGGAFSATIFGVSVTFTTPDSAMQQRQ